MRLGSMGMSVAASAVASRRDSDSERRSGMRRSRSEPLLRMRCSFIRLSHADADADADADAAAAASRRLNKSFLSRSISAFSLGSTFVPTSPDEEVNVLCHSDNVSKKTRADHNWVQRICQIRSRWKDGDTDRDHEARLEAQAQPAKWEDDDDDDCGCGLTYESQSDSEDDKEEDFTRFLNRASGTEIKLFSHLAFLCNIAYVIPQIKADELRRCYGLRLVTSSMDKKQEVAIKASLDADSTRATSPERLPASQSQSVLSSSVAYEIAATAASYIRNKAKSLLYLGAQASCDGNDDAANRQAGRKCRAYKSKVATYVAASSVTAVVAAEEKVRLEAARELQSLHSSPCDWFVCDDPTTSTRCFVIQGSDSVASWQANLLFEPTKFEGTEAMVHRGIYEAAKGIYHQFIPEIESHILAHGQNARFRFTGHSLGGSLSLLITLMLLARNAIPLSALLPVVTFGSPAVFCAGHRALQALRLDEAYILAVMMHRDIVPRAFSCQYPNHVAQLLKRLNTSFRAHACLNTEKLLYFPIGKQYILQPDQNSSPPHPLLPPGAALYVLDGGVGRGALRAFLNSPHPLETLSHPTAYGSDGAILRDHHSSNYVMALNALLRHHTEALLVKRSRRHRVNHWWPLVTGSTVVHGSLPIQINH